MCGIVGFLAKTEAMESRLGEFVTPMFACMADRGPDSGGCAFFVRPNQQHRYNFYTNDAEHWSDAQDSLQERFRDQVEEELSLRTAENHAQLTASLVPDDVIQWVADEQPAVTLLSYGRSINVYKDQGHPKDIAGRYRFTDMSGTHCVGHTRMATESAVTPAHSHPFTGGEDFCLVHNGSLSNPYMLRRQLERKGLKFETDNDTEAACRYVQWKMQEGQGLESAVQSALTELDGFFTLLMATADQMCLVRDAFACKPAVVAETDEYVAIASEFRSLAHLPDIAAANIFEPHPEEIYLWNV